VTVTAAPAASSHGNEPATGLRDALRAEWTKFRTVRGWLLGLALVPTLIALLTYATANGSHTGFCTGPSPTQQTCQSVATTGPDGKPAADTYYLLGRTLTGNGSITARISALTGVTSTAPANQSSLADTRPGLAPWAKAGLTLTASTNQGAPYAAVMVTGAHGVRFQYDYNHDTAGLPGLVGNSSPRWLRLVRSGITLTGYDSSNGREWLKVGTANLAHLPATTKVGLFVTSPVSYPPADGEPTLATASFDDVTVTGQQATSTWRGQNVGLNDFYPTLAAGTSRRASSSFVLSGSGDIAPGLVEGNLDTASSTLTLGLIVGLIILIVVATLFVVGEYRRGLIRTTFTAMPRRRQVLAAKAIVIAAAAFAVGAVAAAVALPISEHFLHASGNYVWPLDTTAETRVVLGVGALLALTAAGVLAIATILRSSAGAVAASIAVFVLPYLLGSASSGGGEQWLFRVAPPAAFAVLQTLPRYAQVSYPQTLGNGYYPLAPWAGLAVLGCYVLLALALAAFLLPRRDA
jgi:ABC-type transport system involved in multi-copper enzyme maturation permease subunit